MGEDGPTHPIATISRLTPGLRRATFLVIAVFVALPFVAAVWGLRQGWQPTGDVGVIGVRSLDAWTRHSPLVGQPTTGGLYADKPSFHPGPIEYWLLGPFIRIAGARVGMALGVAALNAAALAAILWLSFRRGGRILFVLTAVALAGLIRALGAFSLFDPFNSELVTFPSLAAVFAAWSVALGDRRVLPVLAGAVAVAAQTHTASAVCLLPVVVVVVVRLVLGIRRSGLPARDRSAVGAAAAITFVTWLPVVVQELAGPSNLLASYRTATAPHPRMGFAFAFGRLTVSLAPPPLFLRSGSTEIYLAQPGTRSVLLAAVIGGGALSLALLVARGRWRQPLNRLVMVISLATGAAVLTLATGPPTLGVRGDANRWVWILGLLFWLIGSWSLWLLLPDQVRGRLQSVMPLLCLAVTAALLVWSVTQLRLSHVRNGRSMRATGAVVNATLHRLPAGTYHVAFEGLAAVFNVGPSLVYQLEADGYAVDLDGEPFAGSFGNQRARPGRRVDGRLRLVTAGVARPQAGEQLLASAALPETGGLSAYVFLSR